MARPREFDEDRAVAGAMYAFWASGYEATSTAELCAATGLGRSSLYNAFGGKHELFERALVRYQEERTAAIEALLDGEGPVLGRLRALVWGTVDPAPSEPVGCLVVNSLVELAPHDAVVAGLLARDLDRRLRAIRTAIELGQRDGEIDAAKDASTLARFVVASINGLQVMARGGADRIQLQAVASTALSAI